MKSEDYRKFLRDLEYGVQYRDKFTDSDNLFDGIKERVSKLM